MKKDPQKKARRISAKKRSLQTYVNKYARLRDCGASGGANCISCDTWHPYEKLDGGHFIATTSGAIRFNEFNVNAQCHRCNRFLHGNQRHYYKAMVRKYGIEVVEELEAQEFTSKKWTDEELTELKQYYKDKINDLERGFTPEIDTGLDMSGGEVWEDLGATDHLPHPWETNEAEYLAGN